MKNLIKEFLKKTFINIRSADRTKELHDSILSEFKKQYPKYFEKCDWYFEKNISDAYGGKFKVDILGINKITKKYIVILCKCNNSNIGKNIYNSANTTIGEAARLMYGNDKKIEKVLFISIFPRKAPLFKQDGSIRGFDLVEENYKNRINTSDILYEQYKGVVEEINIYYNIKVIDNKINKKDFQPIDVNEISEMRMLYEY
jgi:hypothetical protein|tara:strand:+ start:100 stop:702 length:603 start_codon:yes stop_codon:yes gene_type:complete